MQISWAESPSPHTCEVTSTIDQLLSHCTIHSNPITLQHMVNGVIVLSGFLIAVVPWGGEAP